MRDFCAATPTHFTGHNYIGTEHILLGLLREGEGVAARVLETLGADPTKIRTQVRVWVGAHGVHGLAAAPRRSAVHVQHLTLLHAAHPGYGSSLCMLCHSGLANARLRYALCTPLRQVIRMVGESQETVGAGVGGAQAGGSNKLPTLSEYGTNLTTQAAEVRAPLLAVLAGEIQHWMDITGFQLSAGVAALLRRWMRDFDDSQSAAAAAPASTAEWQSTGCSCCGTALTAAACVGCAGGGVHA
jgi:ATP-dependent Clp protease ATP-binding subunit ClpA